MRDNEMMVEWCARMGFRGTREVGPGEFIGDDFNYQNATTAQDLRSGVDGPHSALADQQCGINGRLYV